MTVPSRAGRPPVARPRAWRRWGWQNWSRHPALGLLLLFALAVVLIWHGEPQPSSRPSGTSVGVSGTASPSVLLPGLLVLAGNRLEVTRQHQVVRTIELPHHATPRSMLTSRGLTVVLAVTDGRQRAYAVTSQYRVLDLGYADAVMPAARGTAAVLVESALVDPGLLPVSASASASASGSDTASDTATASASASRSRPLPGPPPLPDYGIQRYDSAGKPTEPPDRLPRGYRAAVDTAEGLVVWQPVNRVYDSGQVRESLSASALLVRPDATLRALGPVHPLAANATDLLVWDVALHRFGLMPLRYVTSTATSTVSPTASASPTDRESTAGSGKPSPIPTVVAGTQWFLPTRGLLVTGPAAFSDDGTAFAAYAQVGSRRRLVVAQQRNVGTDQVEVLVLTAPPTKSSPVPAASSLVLPSPSGGSSSDSASGSATASSPVLEPDGYPIPAPISPVWLPDNQVVGLAQDGTVIGYQPGSVQSVQLDLGVGPVGALAPAP